MKTNAPDTSTNHLKDISSRPFCIYTGRAKFFLGIILIAILFTSCKGTYKSVKIARERFKTYKIPEALYKDEWGLTSYKFYNPNFDYGRRQFKKETENDFRLVFRRWCKGKDELGKVKKMRVDIFFRIKRFENGTYEVSEVGIERVLPLKFGRQLYTWLGWIGWGLLMFYWFSNPSRNAAASVFTQIFWYSWVALISYHCFMSGWGIVLGLVLNAVVIYSAYTIAKKSQ